MHDVPAPGFWPGIPEATYHSWPLASATALKILAERSPRHLAHARAFPEDLSTPAKLLGRAVHCLLLEPKTFADKFVVGPNGIDRRTKEGKERWAEFIATANGRETLPGDVGITAREIVASIQLHPEAKRLLAAAPERELTAIAPVNGVMCKARADAFRPLGDESLIVDLKVKSGAASRHGFQRMLAEYQYPLGCALYRRVFAALGVKVRDFAFIVAENEPPYGVACYLLDDDSIRVEEAKVDRLLELYDRCQRSGSWPGYSDTIQPISSPGWMLNRMDEGVEIA